MDFRTHVVATNLVDPRGVHIADVDHDGDMDFISGDTALGNVDWWENDGGTTPNFTQHTINRAISPQFGLGVSSYVLARDFTNDGIIDIAYSSVNKDRVAFFSRTGPGPTDYDHTIVTQAPNNGDPTLVGFADRVRMIAAGDLDGDGDIDLTSAGTDNDRVAWYENQDNGTTWVAHSLTDELDGSRAVWVADLDLDGDQDVIGGGWFDSEGLVWFENDGNPEPEFTRHVMSTYPLNINPNPNDTQIYDAEFIDPNDPESKRREDGMLWHMSTEDMDGDGDIDVLAARVGGGPQECCGTILEWHESDGGVNGNPPTFTRHSLKPNGATFKFSGKEAWPSDFDQDGDMDIVFAGRDQDLISWWENDGEVDPTFTEHILQIDPDVPRQQQDGLADGARSVYPADIDGDGDQDMVWVTLYAGSIAWEENLLIQRHADFDRDGDIDSDDLMILEASYGVDAGGDTNGDLVTNATDFLTWQRQYTGAIAPEEFASADFDTDGDVDGDDLEAWSKGYSWTNAFGYNDLGDANNNHMSEGLDFLALQRQYTGSGGSAAVAAASTVPEPSSLLLGTLLAFAAGLRRSRS